MRIKAYLLLMAAALLAPVVIAAALVLETVLTLEREAVLQRMASHAARISIAVDKRVERADAVAIALSTSPLLAAGDWRGFDRQVRQANSHTGFHFNVIDDKAAILINTYSEQAGSMPNLQAMQNERSDRFARSNGPTVPSLVLPRGLDRHVVVIDSPVRVGPRNYVFSQWTFAEEFVSLLRTDDVPSSWLVGLFDREGTTVARNFGSPDLIGKPPRPDLLAAILRADGLVLRNQSRDGIDLYTVLMRSATTGWTVAVGVPVDEVEHAARRATSMAAIGLLVALLAAGAVALFFIRRITGAVRFASKSAAQLGSGRTPEVRDFGVWELKQLQDSLSAAGGLLASAALRQRESMQAVEAARKQAEQQNRAKDEFLALLGHELRNPLSAISAALSLHGFKPDDPEVQRRVLDVVGRQSATLGHMVDELLDASRITQGRVLLQRERLDLAYAVQRSLESLQLRGLTRERTVELAVESAWIDADPVRLDQIVTNLLENAFKYTPAGGAVRISVGRQAESAQLVVADTGQGIDPESLQRIFDVFYQAPVRERSKGGLGIGLTVVRALVEQHGGTIAAASEGIGKGACFTVSLPLAAGAEPPALPSAPARTVASGRVLIVEDNADVRQMLSETLAASGWTTHAAENGMQGLAIAQREQPSAAVIDIDLPDITGYELAGLLRSGSMRQGTLIALTGYGREQDRERALAAGFDVHMAKPVDAAALLAILEQRVASAAGKSGTYPT